MKNFYFLKFFNRNSIIIFLIFAASVNAQITFTETTASAGTALGEGTARGISWFDFNNDNLLDLFVPTAGNIPNKVYMNNGNGTFTEVAAAINLNDLANTITCSFGDFDNDGDIDLVTTATAAPTRLWRNNRDSSNTDTTFTSIEATAGVVQSGGQMVAWADFDNDGLLDFYSPISNSATFPDVLYKNNGDGTFTNVSAAAGVNNQISGPIEQAVHWGDFNKDGYPDLYIGSLQTAGGSFFYENNGNGTFTEKGNIYGINLSGRGAQWIDYNNDGHWDFSQAAYLGATAITPIKLYKNNGSNVFEEVSLTSGITDSVISWGLTWADFDNNGYEDVFVTVSGQSKFCQLYKNNGNGTFTNVTAEAGLDNLVQLHAIWGDYDNDGWMDLYTGGSATNGNHLFKNNGEPGKHWLQFTLKGTESNGSGIGARVKVKAGSLNMMREVNTGIGYRSQNQMRVHFGLNTNTTADSVIVFWPSGIVDVWTNIAADQFLVLIEGSTVPVELISFTAFVTGQNVELKWMTATETNNSGFEVHRKNSSSEWKVVDFVPGSGTTTQIQEYTFKDLNLVPGNYSYRLKQIDYDGTSELLKTIDVEILSPLEFSLGQNYPNPFNPSTKITFSLPVKSNVTISLFNLLGEQMLIVASGEFSEGAHEVTFEAPASLTNGVYYYRMHTSHFSETKKLIYLK
jgi:enediyne biosynthesis protein E4